VDKMAISLQTDTRKETRKGGVDFVLSEGKTLKIKTSPQGEEVLEFTADKDYNCYIYVGLTEKIE